MQRGTRGTAGHTVPQTASIKAHPGRRHLSPRHFSGWSIERRVVRPGTHKGPPYPLNHPVPLHFGDHPTPRRRRNGRGSRGIQHVVARGAVGGGWALVGARYEAAPKSVREREAEARTEEGAGKLTPLQRPYTQPHIRPRPYIRSPLRTWRAYRKSRPLGAGTLGGAAACSCGGL